MTLKNNISCPMLKRRLFKQPLMPHGKERFLKIHLVDGTYELFRCYFGAPLVRTNAGQEVGATRGLLRSLAAWLRSSEVTHIAYAFDHVIESFRNDLFAGYKTGEGIDPDLFSQFELAERAVAAMGVTVWSMVEFEADDALATGAKIFASAKGVAQVQICSPDKDLAQCVKQDKIVCLDRQRQVVMNEEGVKQKFGVPPSAIADLLALVGDSADGIPGIARWGMKSAASLLAVYGKLEKIPLDHQKWSIKVRGAEGLAESLRESFQDALLYRKLATLRDDVPLQENVTDIEWRGADRKALQAICDETGDHGLLDRVHRWST